MRPGRQMSTYRQMIVEIITEIALDIVTEIAVESAINLAISEMRGQIHPSGREDVPELRQAE
eukprot:5378755-Pleurochrysis_carterae.AAC.1